MIQPPCAEGAVNLQSIISQSTSSTKMIVKSTLATHRVRKVPPATIGANISSQCYIRRTKSILNPG